MQTMRRTTRPAPVLLVAAAVGVFLAGCSGDAARVADPTGSPRSTPTVQPTPTRTPGLAVGTTAKTAEGDVTLHQVDYPAAGTSQTRAISTAGFVFAVADIEVCPSTTDGFSPGDFHLFDGDHRDYTFWNVQIGARNPNLTGSLYPATVGLCSRGYLTFEVPPGKGLVTLAYTGPRSAPAIWRLPA